MTTLESICEAIVDCEHKTAPKAQTGHPSIRTTDIKNGRIDFENANRVSDATYDAWTRRRRPMPGDLILAREAPVGEVGYIPDGIFPVLGQRTVLISPDHSEVSSRYLHYLLISPQIQHEFQVRSAGSTVHHLNMKDIRELELPELPPLPEQREIASILGALDDKIELNRRMAATLEEMARALYRSWFVDFDPVKAKAEGLTPAFMDEATATLFPDRFGDNGLPDGWELSKIGDLCSVKGGKQLTRDRFAEDGEFPVFGGAGWMGLTNEYNAQGYVITVGRVGAYCGNFVAYRGKAWVNNNASLISPLKDGFSEFLYLSLKELDLSSIKKGAAQPFISNGDLKELSTILPDNLVLQAFTDRAEPLLRRIENLKHGNNSLADLRDTLLPKLMSGELRVGEAQDQIEEVG